MLDLEYIEQTAYNIGYQRGFDKGKKAAVTEGEWEQLGGIARCSECGHHSIDRYNFCPNCGALMGGKNDE